MCGYSHKARRCEYLSDKYTNEIDASIQLIFNDAVESNLFHALAEGPRTSRELQERLGVSQPTLSRALGRSRSQIAVLGRGRATRYALYRRVRELAPELPIYRISEAGQSARVATLITIAPDWLWYEDLERPSLSREFYSLPWFLTDMRPQGYLGRLFPLRYEDLALPDSIGNWTEDHTLYALARRGEDMAGNLIIGDESLARWLALTDVRTAIDPSERLAEYGRLAEETLAGKVAGSSAAGEQPKFTAELGVSIGEARHVLVKFSPTMDTPAGRRWADLLHAEHIAGVVLREHGHTTVRSTCLGDEQRTYLEVERFDRIGRAGRVGVVSLGSIDDEFVGQRAGWAQSAAALLRAGLVAADDVRKLRWLSAFGLLIGNTDMHLGNAAFLHDGQVRLRLAPVYDMLPMFYAPIRGEVLEREFLVPKPPPHAADQWRAAIPAAVAYWRAVAADARISKEFRSIAERNAASIGRSALHN